MSEIDGKDVKTKRHGKSETAFQTISEVAEDLGLPQHVLRFWETKFSLVSPLKRKGGRRYYRPNDVKLLHQIRHLLHKEGYTIKGVQKLLQDKSRIKHLANLCDDTEKCNTLKDKPILDAYKRIELETLLKELIELRNHLRISEGS